MVESSVGTHLEVISRTRLHPSSQKDLAPRTVPLSILDNSVIKYTLTSAAWYFDPASGPESTSFDALTQSLAKTIEWYPQWAGQLHWLPYDPANEKRHGRAAITYGSTSDPGVELVLTRYPATLASLVPAQEDRMSSFGQAGVAAAWDANSFPSESLMASTELALDNTKEYAGRPAVSVQLTAFACGGLGIRVKIVHALADATAMLQFVKDWAVVHRALLHGEPLPPLSPVFDPSLIDRAAGDITSSTVDPELLRISRSLPMCRYDWWASAQGCPELMLPATRVPPELAGADLGPPGDPAPWSEWDVYAPVSHYLLYFTPEELERIWEAASTPKVESPPSETPHAVRMSRLDALLAFIWRLIIRARGLENDRELVHMMVTIGFRPRLSPPLPESFLGSPITLARVSLTGAEIASSQTSATAAAIRSAMAPFTPSALGALLHDMAYDVNPQHIWQTFLGKRHTTVTSWQNLGVYSVDFGSDAPPRFVEAVMPNMDGCIHVMEAGPAKTMSGGGARWYAEPVSVSLHLAKDVVERLLKDPELMRLKDGG